MRILVVEDDRDLNKQLSHALRNAGYIVDYAFNGEEGHFLGDTEPPTRWCRHHLPRLDGPGAAAMAT
jgi:DNA-binding response OmpR family regulator